MLGLRTQLRRELGHVQNSAGLCRGRSLLGFSQGQFAADRNGTGQHCYLTHDRAGGRATASSALERARAIAIGVVRVVHGAQQRTDGRFLNGLCRLTGAAVVGGDRGHEGTQLIAAKQGLTQQDEHRQQRREALDPGRQS